MRSRHGGLCAVMAEQGIGRDDGSMATAGGLSIEPDVWSGSAILQRWNFPP